MDKETLEAFKGIVKEVIKEETKALEASMQTKWEAAMQAQLEDIVGVIHDVGMMMESKINAVKEDVEELRTEVNEIRTETHAIKKTVERIDERTQNQVEALYEELRVTQREVKDVKRETVRIKAHVGMAA